jgi:hypothetical protein
MFHDVNEIMNYFRVPLRTARRKSVMPPPGFINNSDFLDPSDGPDQSPQNSITSLNSISSLLKEKFAVSTHLKVSKNLCKEGFERQIYQLNSSYGS